MTEREMFAKELVGVIKQMEELAAKERELRDKLMQCMNDGDAVEIDGMEVSKKLIKRTITDQAELAALGYDISRVTVTRTVVDPVLVKKVGLEENRQYYTASPTIVCKKV